MNSKIMAPTARRIPPRKLKPSKLDGGGVTVVGLGSSVLVGWGSSVLVDLGSSVLLEFSASLGVMVVLLSALLGASGTVLSPLVVTSEMFLFVSIEVEVVGTSVTSLEVVWRSSVVDE